MGINFEYIADAIKQNNVKEVITVGNILTIHVKDLSAPLLIECSTQFYADYVADKINTLLSA